MSTFIMLKMTVRPRAVKTYVIPVRMPVTKGVANNSNVIISSPKVDIYLASTTIVSGPGSVTYKKTVLGGEIMFTPQGLQNNWDSPYLNHSMGNFSAT